MIFRYTMYWVVLLISKLAFSFYAEVLHFAVILNVFFLNITRTICKEHIINEDSSLTAVEMILVTFLSTLKYICFSYFPFLGAD